MIVINMMEILNIIVLAVIIILAIRIIISTIKTTVKILVIGTLLLTLMWISFNIF
ncbi:hypothetical protein KKP97_02665 [Methanothermococcus sp. SCGC AD-155-C09]|nr:hypothetical protein [Methanothermococcus sp. SCGC AD-155-C09]